MNATTENVKRGRTKKPTAGIREVKCVGCFITEHNIKAAFCYGCGTALPIQYEGEL